MDTYCYFMEKHLLETLIYFLNNAAQMNLSFYKKRREKRGWERKGEDGRGVGEGKGEEKKQTLAFSQSRADIKPSAAQ